MAGFETLTAAAVPIATDNVDTDQIFPSRFTSKNRDDGGFGRCFLHDWRFDANGRPNEDCLLNDPRLADAKIIVAAANYACGSARPGAIYSHVDHGIQAVIAESFGPVFPTVAFKSGLLTIRLSRDETRRLREQLLASLGSSVTIDLRQQVVVAPDGERIAFDMDPFAKRMFIEGLSEIELTLQLVDRIEAFEARHRAALPWLHGTRSPGA